MDEDGRCPLPLLDVREFDAAGEYGLWLRLELVIDWGRVRPKGCERATRRRCSATASGHGERNARHCCRI